jgi:hypothetical protein
MSAVGFGRTRSSQVVLGLLCLMYLILFVSRVSLSTAAPAMRQDLGLSNAQLGLAFSAFAIPYAAFQLIGGWIGDWLGPRFTLVVRPPGHEDERHGGHRGCTGPVAERFSTCTQVGGAGSQGKRTQSSTVHSHKSGS